MIIAEAGVNHNGSEDLALELIDVAAKCGADAVKFQTFSADNLVRKGAPTAEYQLRETGLADQHGMLKTLELSWESYAKLYRHCAHRQIEFMSTPFDPEAVDFLVSLGMRRIKIPSGEITNTPFLRYVARTGLPLILSTGMADLEEIGAAIEAIQIGRQAAGHKQPLAENLTILHCTSNYPAAFTDINLRAMQTIGKMYALPVGYSDHSLGESVSIAAVALGATVVEKHFTLDKGMEGPDHKASLSPEELARFVQQIRQVEYALGSDQKAPTPSELPVRALVRRSVTTSRAIRSGEILQCDDLVLQRPGGGISPADLELVQGRRAARDIGCGETLLWNDIE
jgi:N,N'-diacetyllegionaminate synthase